MTTLTVSGWLRNYIIDEQTQNAMVDEILRYITAQYSADEGQTFFQGNALSYVVDRMRDYPRRFNMPSNKSDQIAAVFEALGFRAVEARGVRRYRGGKDGLGVTATVITV